MGIDELHQMFIDMAQTERRLPIAIRKQKLASWPDYPLDWHGYGWTQQGDVRLRPTGQQIDEMDRAHSMIMQLELDDRRLVLAGAHSAVGRQRGPRWSRLAHMLGLNDPRIVMRNYRDVLNRLYYKL